MFIEMKRQWRAVKPINIVFAGIRYEPKRISHFSALLNAMTSDYFEKYRDA